MRLTPRQTFRLLARLAVREDAEEDDDPMPPPQAKLPAQPEPPKKRRTRLFSEVRGLGFEGYDCFKYTPREQELEDAGIDPTSDPEAAPRDLARERFYTMALLVCRKVGLEAKPELGLAAVEKGQMEQARLWCDRVWQANCEKYEREKAARDKERADAVPGA